jgi:plasmid stability protein
MSEIPYTVRRIYTAKSLGIDEQTWRRFTVAAARQGKSAETALRELIEDYGETHAANAVLS